MSDKPPELRFDVRLIEARLRRGVVPAAEYQQYLDALPDDAENCEPSRVTFQASYAEKNYRR